MAEHTETHWVTIAVAISVPIALYVGYQWVTYYAAQQGAAQQAATDQAAAANAAAGPGVQTTTPTQITSVAPMTATDWIKSLPALPNLLGTAAATAANTAQSPPSGTTPPTSSTPPTSGAQHE